MSEDGSKSNVHGVDVDSEENTEFKQAFYAARDQLGMGGVFEFRGKIFSTFYKEEWDSLAANQKTIFLNMVKMAEENEGINHALPLVAEISLDMDLKDAFVIAREEIGVGGIFIYDGEMFSTYTDEEFSNLSFEEKGYIERAFGYDRIHTVVSSLDELSIIDVNYSDSVIYSSNSELYSNDNNDALCVDHNSMSEYSCDLNGDNEMCRDDFFDDYADNGELI